MLPSHLVSDNGVQFLTLLWYAANRWCVDYQNQGVIQTKVQVGHRVWDLSVWHPKLPNSKIYMIKINKRAKTK